ncbi:hypothetical protein ACIBG4_11080 [Nonomuraea sp. NPDC050383]|uniref:hypothetical protein n=1 Tax=Nonomuraea sp. NPDC050383 TaxID=3364362 RepID=UPI00379FCD34
MTPDITSAYERRCQLLMRLAYPPRFRESRGAELLGTLLDLAEPGQSRPTMRDCVDVLRSGFMLRLREHPPVWYWLPYQTFAFRLPWRYRWWARDDIQGRFFLERRLVFAALIYGLYFALVQSTLPYWVPALMFGVAYLLLLPAKADTRRKWLARYEFHSDGTSYVYVARSPEVRPGNETDERQPL